jgi:hypothetical protein
MENAPATVISAYTVPPEAQERFNKWFDGAYAPLYLKVPGIRGIDRYKNLSSGIDSPGYFHIYHHQNFDTLKKAGDNPDRAAVIRDTLTWTNAWFWVMCCQLVRSFRNATFMRDSREDSIVDNAPVVHVEGYKLPSDEFEKYNNWFVRWASRLYIPLLIKGTGIKAFNYYRVLDYQLPQWQNFHFLEPDFPSFLSVSYFEDVKALENFKTSLEYAAFKRSLEFEFSGNVKTVWNSEYQLFMSHRPQPGA